MEFKFKPSVDNQSTTIPNPSQTNYSVPVEPTATNQTTVGLQFEHINNIPESNIPTASFTTNLVRDEIPSAPVTTVGLAIDPIKIPEHDDEEEVATPTTTMQIETLRSEDTFRTPTQKFAVQSIPIDDDRSMLPNPSVFEAIAQDLNAHLNNPQATKPEFVTRKMNNWITRLIDQRGEDYITSGKLTADEVGRNSERIIDDMIAGRIDYTRQGQYLIQPVIIETLINYCVNKLAINRAIQYSLGYIYNDYTNRFNINPEDTDRLKALDFINDNLSRNITQAISIVNQDIAIYEIVYNRLTYVQATKNATSLFNLASELNYARKQLKKRY